MAEKEDEKKKKKEEEKPAPSMLQSLGKDIDRLAPFADYRAMTQEERDNESGRDAAFWRLYPRLWAANKKAKEGEDALLKVPEDERGVFWHLDKFKNDYMSKALPLWQDAMTLPFKFIYAPVRSAITGYSTALSAAQSQLAANKYNEWDNRVKELEAEREDIIKEEADNKGASKQDRNKLAQRKAAKEAEIEDAKKTRDQFALDEETHNSLLQGGKGGAAANLLLRMGDDMANDWTFPFQFGAAGAIAKTGLPVIPKALAMGGAATGVHQGGKAIDTDESRKVDKPLEIGREWLLNSLFMLPWAKAGAKYRDATDAADQKLLDYDAAELQAQEDFALKNKRNIEAQKKWDREAADIEAQNEANAAAYEQAQKEYPSKVKEYEQAKADFDARAEQEAAAIREAEAKKAAQEADKAALEAEENKFIGAAEGLDAQQYAWEKLMSAANTKDLPYMEMVHKHLTQPFNREGLKKWRRVNPKTDAVMSTADATAEFRSIAEDAQAAYAGMANDPAIKAKLAEIGTAETPAKKALLEKELQQLRTEYFEKNVRPLVDEAKAAYRGAITGDGELIEGIVDIDPNLYRVLSKTQSGWRYTKLNQRAVGDLTPYERMMLDDVDPAGTLLETLHKVKNGKPEGMNKGWSSGELSVVKDATRDAVVKYGGENAGLAYDMNNAFMEQLAETRSAMSKLDELIRSGNYSGIDKFLMDKTNREAVHRASIYSPDIFGGIPESVQKYFVARGKNGLKFESNFAFPDMDPRLPAKPFVEMTEAEVRKHLGGNPIVLNGRVFTPQNLTQAGLDNAFTSNVLGDDAMKIIRWQERVRNTPEVKVPKASNEKPPVPPEEPVEPNELFIGRERPKDLEYEGVVKPDVKYPNDPWNLGIPQNTGDLIKTGGKYLYLNALAAPHYTGPWLDGGESRLPEKPAAMTPEEQQAADDDYFVSLGGMTSEKKQKPAPKEDKSDDDFFASLGGM